MTDGIFGPMPVAECLLRMERMSERLRKTEEHYRILRNIVDFYHIVAPDDAHTQALRYRRALETIIAMEDHAGPSSLSRDMQNVAREAL